MAKIDKYSANLDNLTKLTVKIPKYIVGVYQVVFYSKALRPLSIILQTWLHSFYLNKKETKGLMFNAQITALRLSYQNKINYKFGKLATLSTYFPLLYIEKEFN